MCCHEALQSDKHDVARHALQLLLVKYQGPGEEMVDTSNVYECAVVIQNLLKLTTSQGMLLLYSLRHSH